MELVCKLNELVQKYDDVRYLYFEIIIYKSLSILFVLTSKELKLVLFLL